MAEVRIDYVRRAGQNANSRLLGLAGREHGGWCMPLDEVIQDLRRDLNTYVVQDGQTRVRVSAHLDARHGMTVTAISPGCARNLLELLDEVPAHLVTLSARKGYESA